MSDNEFDALFKKAADNLEVPYNPRGWKRMQARLNKVGGGYWGTFRKGLLGLAILFVLLGTAWWISEGKNAEVKLEGIIELSATSQDFSAKEFPTIPGAPVPAEGKTEVQESVNSGERMVIESSEEQSTFAPNTSTAKSKETKAEEDFTVLTFQALTKSEAIHLLNAKGIAQEDWNMPKQNLSLVEVPQAELEKEDVTKQKLANRWGISFALSPDLSGVGFKDIHNVSTKVAIQLEFFVLPNLSVSSGAIFANKVYSASPDDYQQKYQYDYKPVGINGQCKVLDIPLNLKWYALSGAKSRFFISGGLSSYMMLTEDYEYVYREKGKYDKYYSRNYGYKHENNHLFKVANFSLGYERRLGRQWAIQAEPFVKLPLAGVGEGSLKLSTMGTFLSVHYRWGGR